MPAPADNEPKTVSFKLRIGRETRGSRCDRRISARPEASITKIADEPFNGAVAPRTG